MNFLGANISKKQIQKQISSKENVQQKGQFGKYENWSKQESEQLKNICGDLANKYNYDL